eukprot:3293478-Alexandrium_andersonii.AAC.1
MDLAPSVLEPLLAAPVDAMAAASEAGSEDLRAAARAALKEEEEEPTERELLDGYLAGPSFEEDMAAAA